MEMVKAWKEKIIIPTYEVGTAEKYPIFLEKRIYQGSSGAVYPNPVIESISDERIDKEWTALFIENKYIKIMVLPELGGRIQMAFDKIKNRHFVYYNNVIKPALVGLTGPWISGGIEFNWPQHHRPSTYDPVDWKIEENEDGSTTVWVSEIERMFRTKGMAGFTLHPDKAYLEIKVQLYNRTPLPQTFLWWANPAVAVNEEYQSIFPPDVNAVFDHGKRDVSTFPIATGTYYKVDYSPGTDISRYKNIPVPTSYMAITSEYDFVGGYENDSKGGLLHVANHHVSPGKKQWTWGNGDFGRAWDRNLTDADGPYIELMCGVYTDNQPDFSWMHPYEEKNFVQYFMPFHSVGMVKNATKDALVNIENKGEELELKVYVTSGYPEGNIQISLDGKKFWEEFADLSPEVAFEKTIDFRDKDFSSLEISIYDRKGKTLVSWSPNKTIIKPIPEAAVPAKDPKEIKSIEQLFLQGLHLEQYRHATYLPSAYYEEALLREPGDVRNNNAMGLWYFKKGKLKEAALHFEKAIETLVERNPNPYDGEPFFNLGLVHKFFGEHKKAYEAFFKSCWNAGWQDPGYFNLSQLDCWRADHEEGLVNINNSLIRNTRNHKANHLKAVLLRKLGREEEALKQIESALKMDQFNFGVHYEKYLLTGSRGILKDLKELLRDNAHNYIEIALDYAQAGLFREALAFLDLLLEKKAEVYPMIYYFKGWFQESLGDIKAGISSFETASQMPSDYCFPNRLEEMLALLSAIKLNPKDSKAYYYLGNFWYANRQYPEALESWETSRGLNGDFPIVHRNLALIYFNKLNKKEVALQALERAFELDNKNPRVLMELDQLYKKLNKPVKDRFQLLKENINLVYGRDDLYIEWVILHNIYGDREKALDLIMNRSFHPWEGGEGKVSLQYIYAHLGLALTSIRNKNYEKSLAHLNAAKTFPENIGEGKLSGALENDIFYWEACCYEGLGKPEMAEEKFKEASKGSVQLSPALYYNDQQPDKILYQGMALMKLGATLEAEEKFRELIEYGEDHMKDNPKLDFFAVSLPDLLIWDEKLERQNIIHCHYLIGLGQFGLKNFEAAASEFAEVLKLNKYHIGAFWHLDIIKKFKEE